LTYKLTNAPLASCQKKECSEDIGLSENYSVENFPGEETPFRLIARSGFSRRSSSVG